jgi:hypothetical protein
VTDTTADPLRAIVDRQAVIDTVVSYATGIDLRDWELYRRIFTDPCWFDFSSWSRRPPAEMTAADWVHAVRSVNGNFDATQHLSTNHVVTFTDVDRATCRSYMQAQHFFEPETMAALGRPDDVNVCTLGGYYTNQLVRVGDGWKIARCQLTVTWQTGNADIFDLARSRPSTG